MELANNRNQCKIIFEAEKSSSLLWSVVFLKGCAKNVLKNNDRKNTKLRLGFFLNIDYRYHYVVCTLVAT